MSKKRKITVSVICAVFAVCLIAAAVLGALLPHALNYPIDDIDPVGSVLTVGEKTEDSVALTKPGAEPLKILMFTDMHLDGKNSTSYKTVERMVDSITKEKPDLVLLGGDNVTSGMNRRRASQLGEIFEKLGVYWGGVLGNHEGDNKWSISRTEMMDIFCSFEHCVMQKGPADIDGDCNYVIKLMNDDGSLREAVFCLDTFDETTDQMREEHSFYEDKHYDGAHANQVAWYGSAAEELKQSFGDYKSIMLIHIPTHEFDAVAEQESYLWGVKNEGVCSTAYDNGLFAKIKELGVTQAVFCGHDHINSFGGEYDGVTLSYIESSGYGSYGMAKRDAPPSEWLQGYTALRIAPDGEFTHTQMRYAEIYSDQ